MCKLIGLYEIFLVSNLINLFNFLFNINIKIDIILMFRKKFMFKRVKGSDGNNYDIKETVFVRFLV